MSHRRRGGLPNSMLDLIWILLFFFLMISTVRRQETERTVTVDLVPLGGAAPIDGATDIRQVVLEIRPGGEWTIDGQPLERDELRTRLERLRAPVEERPVLVLDVDRRALVEDLLRVEDTARELGIPRVVRRRQEGGRP